ncbi:MAG: DNA-directed RNA polymerase subunit omega [Christensenellales bacterium]|jgi:DNA-directed RNA polymerase subunit omega
MLYPPIGELISITNNRYAFVIAVAKRARQIVDHVTVLTEHESSNPVTTAVYELYEGKVAVENLEDLD